MKFGQQYNQEEESTGSSDFLRYFKKDRPETTFRVLQEPEEWIDYWEHFNPGGYPFPCTRDKQNCPGCKSANEKMKKANLPISASSALINAHWSAVSRRIVNTLTPAF